MRVRRWSGALAGAPFACIVGYMAAHAVPEPPRRPADIQADQPPAKSSSTVRTQEAPAKPSTPPRAGSTLDPEQAMAESVNCVARLERLGLTIELVTLGAEKNDACVIEIPVRLTSLKLSDQEGEISFPDRPLLACEFAEQFGRWVRDLAAPLVQARLAPLKAVRTGPGFVCRNRNNQAGSKLSAHAVGLAVDIAAFQLANGEVISVAEDKDAKKSAVLATMRTAACGWFTTILGPGSDAAHATHWHLDIQRHGSSDNYRICQ
jgi:hypothetical protein